MRGAGCVIPAAGDGLRLGGPRRKPFVTLSGAPLIVHALRACERATTIESVVVVAHAADQEAMRRLVAAQRLRKVRAVVPGGASRAESVRLGVAALPAPVAWVAIHDAARPCVRPALFDAAVAEARRCGAVACGLPASVTVKAVDAARQVRLTLDRESLWFLQTPQVCRRDWLLEAMARAGERLASFPDDVSILEWAGFPVRMVPGDPWNLKVTTREDLVLAEAILKAQQGGGGRLQATSSKRHAFRKKTEGVTPAA